MFRMKLVGLGPAAAVATATPVLPAGTAGAAPASTPTAAGIQAAADDAITVHGPSTLLDRIPSSRGL